MLRATRLRAVQPRDQNYRPSNLNPEDILDLCEHCQVELIGGWTKKCRLLTAIIVPAPKRQKQKQVTQEDALVQQQKHQLFWQSFCCLIYCYT